MVRIGGSTDTGKHIKEHDYYTPTGEFRVDREGSPVLLNCLMYKMCYYRFGQVYTEASENTFYLHVVELKIKKMLFRCLGFWIIPETFSSWSFDRIKISSILRNDREKMAINYIIFNLTLEPWE